MPRGDEELITWLAGGKSYEAAAALCGVSKSTVIRRMRSAAFRRKVRQARADVLERALGHLSRGSAEAAITLRNLLRSDSPNVRLQAAVAVLRAEHSFRESEELAAELADLKEQVARLRRAEKRRKAHGAAPGS